MSDSLRPVGPRALGAELRTVILSLTVGFLLMSLKFIAYYLTQSTAIFSDALENVVNVLTSGFAVYAVLLAHRPADEEHPYGHGKVEFLSAGFEGGMILFAAMLIVFRAGEAIFEHQHPNNILIGIGVTAASTVLCLVTGLILRQRGIASGSITLEADGLHLLSDAITGAAVLAALLVVSLTHLWWIDPVVAVAVGGWLTVQGLILIRRAAAGLMDEQDRGDATLLNEILTSHVGPNGVEPRICSYHKLRHRHSGRLHWVEFHIQVPAGLSVEQGHRIATSIEMAIEWKLGQCSATAHVEPCTAEGCLNCKREKA
jgi:cation diffusion facilitator family transporter